MSASDISDRLMVLAIGVLVLLAPVMIVALTVAFLALTGDLLLGNVTLLEFLELYVIELVLFVLFAYGLYRLTLALVRRQLPESLDALESDGTEGTRDEPRRDRD